MFSWKLLRKPFFVLAPMDGATDTVFRQIVGYCGMPDVFVTEFTNVEGLLSRGRKEVEKRLKFSKKEKPIIAQIWGTNPDSFEKASKIIVKMGFDGIDINMGCPVRAIIHGGSCSALIKNQELAKEIIYSTKKGASGLPVSVKTRIGFSKLEIETWIAFLLRQKLDCLAIHLRTAKEMSLVPAHWEIAGKIVELRDKLSPETMIIGNGDVKSIIEGEEKALRSGMDGIMIGRGVFHNPYVFNRDIDYDSLGREAKIALMVRHLDLFKKTWREEKNFSPLKRFFKIYIQGFSGASDLREKLMETSNLNETYALLSGN